MFRSGSRSTVLALAILTLVPGIAGASSIAVRGSTFNETFSFPDGTTTFHHAPEEGDSHGYSVDITLDSFGDWGSITFDAQNFSQENIAFTLNFTVPLDPATYDEAHGSITGNGTWSARPFAVGGASLVLDAGPPRTNLGVDVSSGCTPPSGNSSFLCATADAGAAFAPRLYNILYGSLTFSMGGSGRGVASEANHLEWDGYFEVDDPAPAPEPVGLPLIGGGLLALALRRRRA